MGRPFTRGGPLLCTHACADEQVHTRAGGTHTRKRVAGVVGVRRYTREETGTHHLGRNPRRSYTEFIGTRCHQVHRAPGEQTPPREG